MEATFSPLRSRGCSLFVGNIHTVTDQAILRNYFIRAGDVMDVYIPSNQSSFTNTKYGFVRFRNRDEALAVARRCNGDFVWGYHLVVKPAHRERRDALQNQQTSHIQKETTAANMGTNWISKLKGNTNSLSYKPKDMDLQWLKGCAVGYQTYDESILGMQEYLRKKGMQCTILYMGGRMVMLSFFSEELMRDAINVEHEWFNDHFEFIKPWDTTDLPKHRYKWIKCEQVPIHAWNSDFFRMIGDLYGRTVGVDSRTELKTRLDFGRVLIHTPVIESINRKHNVCIDGITYEILVTEDQGCSFNPDRDASIFLNNTLLERNCKGETHRKFTGEEVGDCVNQGGISKSPNSSQNLNPSVGAIGSGTMGCFEEPTASAGSTQVVPESPVDYSNPTVFPKPLEHPDAILNPFPNPISKSNSKICSTLVTEVGVEGEEEGEVREGGEHITHSSHEEDDISPAEDLYIDLDQTRRMAIREKRISRRKALSSIVENASSGKLLKQQLVKHSKNQQKKSEVKRKRRGKKKGCKQNSQEESPSATAEGSLPEENIRNRNEEIHKAAEFSWNLGLAMGMSACEPDDDVTGLMVEIEERDWDAYEQRHNE